MAIMKRKPLAGLPSLPEEEVARVCYLLLMQALPALAESRLRHFGDAITDIQRSVGNYFAAAQGGRYTSADVGVALDWLGEQGAVGLGQSSWGPTGFCLVEEEQAEILLDVAETRFQTRFDIKFYGCDGAKSRRRSFRCRI